MERAMAPELKQELLGRWEPLYRSQLHYLVTWSTRGRRPVLRERHVRTLKRLIHQTCDECGFVLLDAAAGAEHVHVLIGLRPSQSVAGAVRELKGGISLMLLSQHPELRVWLGGNLVWDERYAVETVSALRLQRVRDRLKSLHSAEDLAEAS